MSEVRMWAVYAGRRKTPLVAAVLKTDAEGMARAWFNVWDTDPGYRCVRVRVRVIEEESDGR